MNTYDDMNEISIHGVVIHEMLELVKLYVA